MTINLSKLFNKQYELDKHIHANHHVSYKVIGKELKLALIVELSELANEIRSFKFWSLKPSSAKNIILEEYVDGIHFITSLCIKYKVKPIFEVKKANKYTSKQQITKAFIWLFKKASNINNGLKAKSWYKHYLNFGIKLGFNIKQIVNAYNLKNKVNHKRQDQKY